LIVEASEKLGLSVKFIKVSHLWLLSNNVKL
jgi:hypothetical protein